MSNPYLTGSFNKYRNKIRGNMKTSFSITPNTKITQYLERKKNVVNHKSPSNALNKSQNIRENKRIPKINLKNYIINKRLNKKKISKKKKLKYHNRKSNSINPMNSNFSIKLNSMNSLPGCFINNNTTYYINNNTNNNSNINNITNNNNNINNFNNKSMSKNNSLSYYYTSNNNTTNKNNKNLGKIINDYNLQKLMCVKANMSYYSNFNYNKGLFRLTKKSPTVNLTTDNSNSRNIKSPSGNYFITEESKLALKEKKKINNRSKPKTSYINTKKSKKKSSNNIFSKIKSNIPLKIPHKNSYHRPQMGFLGETSTEKNVYFPSIESVELKLIKELNNIKNVEKDKKYEKLKSIFEESIEHFIPNQYQKIFYMIIKELDDINKMNINDVKYLKEKKEELNNKIKIIENENQIYKIQLEENNKEIDSMKTQLIKKQENILSFPYKNHTNNKKIKFHNEKGKNFFKNKNMDEDEDNLNSESDFKESISNNIYQISRNNEYLIELNKKNLNDLDAIYFFDKINDKNSKNKNNKSESNQKNNNHSNYINNKGEIIPELNLDPNYIEECKNKELLKIEEENLTPFQKIALQFEVS